MKNLLIAIFVFFCFTSQAQITMEHRYDSTTSSFFGTVKFSQLGQKYLFLNSGYHVSPPTAIFIYNLDHSLYKSIPIPHYSNYYFNILFAVSDSLFNNNSKIEFGIEYGNLSGAYAVVIYDEDTNVVFSQDSAQTNDSYLGLAGYGSPNVTTIIKTDQGTKMALMRNGHFPTIYALPGSFLGISQPGSYPNEAIFDAYPNPSHSTTKIKYELPEGTNEGDLKVYDINGQELKNYRVDRTFNDLLIDNSSLSSGTYFYQLSTSQGAVGTKKIFVIR